jgi:hypothetical protein
VALTHGPYKAIMGGLRTKAGAEGSSKAHLGLG